MEEEREDKRWRKRERTKEKGREKGGKREVGRAGVGREGDRKGLGCCVP